MPNTLKPTRVTLSPSNWITLVGMFTASVVTIVTYTSHISQQIGLNTHDIARHEKALAETARLVHDTSQTLSRIQGKLDRAEQQ